LPNGQRFRNHRGQARCDLPVPQHHAREADDLVRDVEAFLRLVERAVGFSAIRERTIDAAAATGP
jgi:hypothetical protein